MPRARHIERDQQPLAHSVGQRETLAARRGARVDDTLAGLRRHRLDRDTRARISQINFPVGQRPRRLRPMAGLHREPTRPRGRLQPDQIRLTRRRLQSPARMHGRRLQIPFHQLTRARRAELREPTLDQPIRRRKIISQHRRRGDFARCLLRRQRIGQLAHHRVDQARLGIARQGLCLRHRVMTHLSRVPLASALDQLVARQQQNRHDPRAGTQPHQGRDHVFDASVVPHRAVKQVLAARPGPARQLDRVQKRIGAHFLVQPPDQQARGHGPGIGRIHGGAIGNGRRHKIKGSAVEKDSRDMRGKGGTPPSPAVVATTKNASKSRTVDTTPLHPLC